MATVAAQMRHADLTTTLRYHTHAQEHLRKAAADAFDAAVFATDGDSRPIQGRKLVAREGQELVAAEAGGGEFGSTSR